MTRSNRPAGKGFDTMAQLLEKKLEKLEEMLVVTEALRTGGKAHLFQERIGGLIDEVNQLNHALQASEAQTPEGTEELERKIAGTVKRLGKANAALMASVKARQEIIGNKIAKLKNKKDFLRNLDPSIPREPTLVDSDL